jgi:hypothetical protein
MPPGPTFTEAVMPAESSRLQGSRPGSRGYRDPPYGTIKQFFISTAGNLKSGLVRQWCCTVLKGSGRYRNNLAKPAVDEGELIMIPRIVAPTVAFLALLLLAMGQAPPALAAEAMDGTVESAGSGKISIKDKSGKVHSFDVDDSAKITLDGKSVKLDEVGVGSSASVTTETKNSKTVATMIMAKSKLHLSGVPAASLSADQPRVSAQGQQFGRSPRSKYSAGIAKLAPKVCF